MTDEALDPISAMYSEGASSAPEASQAATQATDTPQSDLVGDMYAEGANPRRTGAFEAAGVHAAAGVVPTGGGLAGAGAGAELGAAGGALVGGPFGAAAGGLVGALVGGIGGSWLAGKAQDYAIQQLPDTWRDPLEEELKKTEAQHPVASFLGGLVPMAATMTPSMGAVAELPQNATALQRLMANPVTARMFGGAVQGGLEYGQEKALDGEADWRKVAASTAFGVVFNRPNRIGERITELGAAPARGVVHDFNTPLSDLKAPPTIAQANDLGIIGPGATEETFKGSQQRDPDAKMAAEDAARVEKMTLEPPAQPDLHETARKIEPELFTAWDQLNAQRENFRNWIADYNNPPQEQFDAMEAKRTELEAQLAATRNKDEQRRIRTQIRVDVDYALRDLNARRDAHEAGEAQETPELAAARKQLMAVDEQMRDMGPHVAAAYRRAAEWTGAETVEPEAPEAAPQPQAPTQTPEAQPAAAVTPETTEAAPMAAPARSIEDQKAFIAEDVKRQLVAAARPEIEAEAAAQIIAARYVARAGLFKGALGSAEELYRREGADIRGQGGVPVGGAKTPNGLDPQAARAKADTLGVSKLIDDLAEKGASAKEIAPLVKGKLTAAEIDAMLGQKELAQSQDTAKVRELSQSTGNASAAQSLMDGGGLHSPKELADFGESIAGSSQPSRLVSRESSISMMNEMRRAAVEQGEVLDSIVRLVPVDVVDNLFGSETAAKVALHDEAMLKNGPAFDADLSISDLGGRSRSVRLLLSKIALERAERGFSPSGAARESSEGNAASSANDVSSFSQGLSSKKAVIRIYNNKKSVITLFKNADASSFIHETGHDFLEQIMRDADHPAAPDALKDDAQTVKDWLGVNDRDEIKTKHHEKFARGFEQYIREGVAPSKDLAGVFAKFKQWMLSIYQTIKGLGAPISDDIRGVFDRMLAEEPQRTVIAPERTAGPSLADIHESEAAYAEPHEAEAMAMRVGAERLRAETEAHPEIAREVAPVVEEVKAARSAQAEGAAGQSGGNPAADAAGGESESAGGRGGVDGGGGGPASQPGGEPLRAESGTQREGRSEPVGEGASVSGSEQRRGNAGSNVPAPKPADAFDRSDERLVDRAGNIRLENLTTVEDVKQAMRDAAGRNDDFIGDRRGVVTDGQVMDLAYDLGMEGAEKLVKERVIGQAFNAEQIMCLRLALKQSSNAVWQAMKKAAEGGDEDVLAYAQARDRHQMIQAVVAQATAEWGRAGRALRNISHLPEEGNLSDFVRKATGKTLFQLKAEAKLGATLDTPQQVSKFIRDSQKHSFGRMVLEYWINGLISGPTTHVTYSIGNTLLRMLDAGPETAAAAMVGNIRRAMGREGEIVHYGEVGEQFKAGARALPAAVKGIVEAARSNKNVTLPGEEPNTPQMFQYGSEFAPAPTLDEKATWKDVGASVFGLLRGIRDGVVASAELIKAGGVEGAPQVGWSYSPSGAIPNLAYKGVDVFPLGDIVRAPGRMIAGAHSFFRVSGYSMSVAAQAYRQAAEEGLTGSALAARIGELRQNPTPEMMETARNSAIDLALMGKGSEMTQALSRLTNVKFNLPVFGETQLLKFIDPFVHISSNVIDQSLIQRTPLGAVLSPELRATLAGKYGNIAQDKAVGRMLVGSSMAMLFGGLAMEGYASGSGPSDPKKAAMWRLAGNQAHSVRIGDIWYDTHRLGPIGMLMGVAADLYDVVHAANQGDFQTAAATLQHAITQNVLDESFMRGPADLIKAIDDPGRYGDAYVRNFISSFVPFSVGMAQIARASDPYSRQARTIADAMKAKIPGLSQDLRPRRDVWGEPMPSREALGGKGVTAIYETQMSRDPVNLALLSLGIGVAQPRRVIRGVHLDDQQYDDYQRLAGRMAKMRLDAIVNSPAFASMPNHVKHDVIEQTLKQSREAATGYMMMKYRSIIQGARDLKMKKLQD